MRKYLFLVTAISTALSGQVFTSIFPQMDNDTITVTMVTRGFIGQPRTNAPYSGEKVTENVETLADGTHIRQAPTNQRVFRDSKGRMRMERLVIHSPNQTGRVPMIVEIDDPVAGVAYLLDGQNKVAHRLAHLALPRPIGSRSPVTPTVAVLRPVHKSEDLGEQNIEGIMARGTRNTTTWPIDSQGNDRPITDVGESWFSRELGVPVLGKYSSPRSGETSTRLINISRAEPEPSLFQPPADYTVVDEKDSFKITLKR